MPQEKKQLPKTRLHARNRNRERYDLKALKRENPALEKYIQPNKHGADSIDFANPSAVKLLNKGLLNHYYGIKHWDFPDENLCPPIPGRADYLHYMADLLSENNESQIPKGNNITCLDIGVGANCIYPIIGVVEYDWQFIGTDISPKSIEAALNIVATNPQLQNKITCKLQANSKHIFHSIINPKDKIDLSICNPPFHASIEAAEKGSRRKVKNLSGKKTKNPQLNFAGISKELVCEGGEGQFIQEMIRESKQFASNFYWFSTLVSKQSNLKGIYKLLEHVQAKRVKTIPMGTGNKSSRIVAWTFLSRAEQKAWRATRWELDTDASANTSEIAEK